MQKPPIPADETQRLRALRQLSILDTAGEERFDRITRLAAHMFHVPIALVTLVDGERQWFKSRLGIDACETGRDVSFCAHAINFATTFVVRDTRQDERFVDHPAVIGPPHVRFYAGRPVHAPNGARVGTLCIADSAPREFSVDDERALSDLAGMVDRELSLVTLASIDELTHLSNRRGFAELGAHVLALCSRSGCAVTLAEIDLDGFKAINDNHGHAAGDRVLRKFSNLLLKHFRSADVVARLGGDEFCVLASGTSCADFEESLQRFAISYAQSALAATYPDLSWSVGLAECPAGTSADLQALLLQADERMYAAKGSHGKLRRPVLNARFDA